MNIKQEGCSSGVGNRSDSVTQQQQVEPQAADRAEGEQTPQQQSAPDKENDESSIGGETSSPNGVKR